MSSLKLKVMCSFPVRELDVFKGIFNFFWSGNIGIEGNFDNFVNEYV